MSKNEECGKTKIEAGQILHPDHFPPPNELVCIQVPKVFDQVSLRDCQTVVGVYLKGTSSESSNVFFKQARDFDITNITVFSKTDSLTKPGYKKLKLGVEVSYYIDYQYTDGNHTHDATMEHKTVFDVVVFNIYCPDCTSQIGLVRYPGGKGALDVDGTLIKVEGMIDVFNTLVSPPSGHAENYTLTFDIGAFFIVKCECEVQLLIPAYGYCPVPPEQEFTPLSEQNCATFSNRCATPFPTQFFPDQKWNPLDKGKKEDWDD